MIIIKKITAVALTLFLFCAVMIEIVPGANAAGGLSVDASAAILVEVSSGTVLFSNNSTTRLPPASLTKLMTALLAAEAVENGRLKLTDNVTISEDVFLDLNDECSSADLEEGEEIPLEQLLYLCLMESDCDAANAIAVAVSGSIPVFITEMNRRAEEMGCTNTHFTNTHGAHSEGMYTTAEDMAVITREALSHTAVSRACAAITHSVPSTNESSIRHLENSNSLINPESRYYNEFVTGGKTGYTDEAGQCIAAAGNNSEISLVAVILGSRTVLEEDESTTNLALADAGRMFNWGFNSFGYREILSVSDLMTEVPVEMGDGADSVLLHPVNSITALMDRTIPDTEFHYDVTVYAEENGEKLVAPIEAGQILGEVTVSYNGVTYGTVELAASSSVGLLHIEYIRSQFRQVLQQKWVRILFRVVIILILVYLLYIILYSVLRARRKRLARARAKKRLAMITQMEQKTNPTQRDTSDTAEEERQIASHKSFEEIYRRQK